ncbi:MAG: hypothetical protein HGB05_23070, partial [Chloroflexi bacterium]|nr:hypothetical protein [Chloroflexota bacterium]
IMGMAVDATTAKQGKHRLWLLVSIVPFIVTFVLNLISRFVVQRFREVYD